MNKTAVIVGGGLGGLFTAAILSKEGVKVTVLEKNLNLGGGLQSFKRFGEVYDAGMHILVFARYAIISVLRIRCIYVLWMMTVLMNFIL